MYSSNDHNASVYQIDEEYYYVSSANTLDHGWETMIFSSNEQGDVDDWRELYVFRGIEPLEASARKFGNKTGGCDNYSLD